MYEINICMAALESNPTSGIGLQPKHLLFSWPKRIHLKAIFMHRNVQISELNMQTSMCFRCSLSWPSFLPLFILLPDLSHPIPSHPITYTSLGILAVAVRSIYPSLTMSNILPMMNDSADLMNVFCGLCLPPSSAHKKRPWKRQMIYKNSTEMAFSADTSLLM